MKASYRAELLRLGECLYAELSKDLHMLRLYGSWQPSTGLEVAQMEERPLRDFLHPDEVDSVTARLRKVAFSKTKSDQLELRFGAVSGAYRRLSWKVSLSGDDEILLCFIYDVTETHKHAELMADIQNLASIGDWSVDIEKRKVTWSDVTYRIHEVAPGTEISLEEAIAFYPGEHGSTIEKLVREGMESGRAWDVELQIRTRAGKSRWVRTIGHATTENGKAVRLEGIFQDIHERKTVEIALQENYERLRGYEIALDTHSIVAKTDPAGKITYVNSNFCAIAKYSEEEVLGQDHRILNSGYHPKPFFRGLWETILAKKSWRGKIRNRAKDGSHYWVDTLITPILDGNGEVREFLAIRNDITKLKEQEAALEESHRRYELVAEAANVGIWDWLDVSSERQYWSPRFFSLLGYEDQEAPASMTAFRELVHPEDREAALDFATRHTHNGAPLSAEYRLKCKDGSYRWFHGCTKADFDEAGRLKRVVGSVQDIHEKKMFELELKRSNEDLDQFAHIASHDLREPLRGMKNFSQFLMEDYAAYIDGKGVKYLETIQKLCVRLERYLDSLLYYSRLGREEMAYGEKDLNELLEEVADTFRSSAKGEVIDISWDHMPTIVCDSIKLTKIFGNLIQNSIRYNLRNPKRIEIACKSLGAHMWEFHVKDNGIGIKREHWERVFTLFKRLHPREEFEGGSGIGLTLVKKAVERHGGEIWITSEPGEGTVFHFTLKEHSQSE